MWIDSALVKKHVSGKNLRTTPVNCNDVTHIEYVYLKVKKQSDKICIYQVHAQDLMGKRGEPTQAKNAMDTCKVYPVRAMLSKKGALCEII